jgi:hypothetical protein
MSNPPPAATDFKTAIDRMRWSALKLFNSGFDTANATPQEPNPTWPEEKKREFRKTQAENISKAEAQMGKALSQLNDLDKQVADNTAYTQVSDLMKTVATKASTMVTRIEALIPDSGSTPVAPSVLNEIDALRAVLAALAALSPAANFKKASDGGNTQ